MTESVPAPVVSGEITQRTRVAAYVVCIVEGRILLTRYVHHDDRHWTLPGGGLDHAEHPHDAAVREFAEETGFAVQLDRLLGIGSQQRRIAPRPPQGSSLDLHTVQIYYSGHIVGGELRHETNGSTDQAAWFELGKIPVLLRAPIVDVGLELLATAPADGTVPAARRIDPTVRGPKPTA